MECDNCERERGTGEPDYTPLQVLTGQALGWYSDDDGELCGECMTALLAKANR